ncbi:MAG: type II toxin-antitoxin system MqsR family toxin [Alphaproteobacteria bacterium]|nr:type II toxin-antitoxin system MqsR family toxin [Alphaproteobacteria bacterium]
MEKRKPAYDIDAVKAAIGSVETLAITRTALSDALSLGFNRPGIVAVVQGIKRTMFVKSMTTHADHRLWQDVYHVPADDLVLYVKFQADIVTEFRVVSFKEK